MKPFAWPAGRHSSWDGDGVNGPAVVAEHDSSFCGVVGMNIVYFGLRVKGTEKFFLRRPNQRRGYSMDEPEEPTQDKPARLFPSRKSAQNALIQWRRGVQVHKVSYPSSWASMDTGQEDWTEIEVVPARKSVEVEVVLLYLSDSTTGVTK